MSLGPGEVLIVLMVALIVLGPDKLPQAARNIAKVYKDVRNFSTSVRSQVEDALELDDTRPPKKPAGPSDNPPKPDLSGFTLVDNPPASQMPEPPRGAPLFQPDEAAPDLPPATDSTPEEQK